MCRALTNATLTNGGRAVLSPPSLWRHFLFSLALRLLRLGFASAVRTSFHRGLQAPVLAGPCCSWGSSIKNSSSSTWKAAQRPGTSSRLPGLWHTSCPTRTHLFGLHNTCRPSLLLVDLCSQVPPPILGPTLRPPASASAPLLGVSESWP